MKITDNVFVVTGAGNGMGRQVLLGLVRRGARVAAVDLDEHGLTETERLARIARGTVSSWMSPTGPRSRHCRRR